MNLELRAIKQSEELKTADGYNKHIHCDGSREHVLSYSSKGIHCSQNNCVVNRNNQENISDWIFIKR
ncbi:hypothetical protein MHI32_01525 [Paenibacillus sp. FSL H7-0690]|uniref:hypothetical protein n=1 Tax=Paenibacillus sp. FSL H7-0690 TaxID=2921437 RepID=UPI0030EF0A04